MTELSDFIYHRHQYPGKTQPKNQAFDANLQEFAQRVSYICGLEMNGKISPETAYQEIRGMWHHLEQSIHELSIDQNSTSDSDR